MNKKACVFPPESNLCAVNLSSGVKDSDEVLTAVLGWSV